MDDEKIIGWHFLPASMCLLNDDNRLALVGETLSVSGKIAYRPNPNKGESGLHCSTEIIDTLSYTPALRAAVMCRVEVWGDIVRYKNQVAGRHRKLLWYVPMNKTIQIIMEWALNCAYAALRAETQVTLTTDTISAYVLGEIQNWLNGNSNRNRLQQALVSANANAIDDIRKAVSCLAICCGLCGS